MRRPSAVTGLVAVLLVAPYAAAQEAPWVVFGHDGVLVRDGAQVTGDVVVEDARVAPWLAYDAEVTIGAGAVVNGTVTADTVSLRDGCSVSETVVSNELLEGVGVTIGTPPQSPAPLPMAWMFGNPPPADAPPDVQPVTVAPGAELSLAPGEYGALVLQAGTEEAPTVVDLSEGEYLFTGLQAAPHAYVVLDGMVDVLVTGRVSLAAGSYVGLTPQSPADMLFDDTALIVLGDNGGGGGLAGVPPAVDVAAGAAVYTQVWAPNGSVVIGDGAVVLGRVAARWIDVGAGATVTLGGSGCGYGLLNGMLSPEVECLDGDGCTVDACDGATGTCTHEGTPGCDAEPPEWPWEGAWLEVVPGSGGDVTLDWHVEATDDVGVVSYRVRDGEQELAVVPAPATSYTLAVQQGTTYAFAIEALDAAGNASWPLFNGEWLAQDSAPPHWPFPAQAADVHGTWIGLTWAQATDDTAVDHYVVSSQSGQGETREDIVPASETAFVLSGLSPDTTWWITVQAVDAAGNWSGQDSPFFALTTRDTDPPTWDAGDLSAMVVGGVVQLDWTAATWSDDVGVTGFQVLVFADGNALYEQYWQSVGTATTLDLDPTLGTTFTVAVTACDAAGLCADPYPTATVDVPPEALAPTWHAGSGAWVGYVTDTRVGLSWTPAYDPSGVVGYRIRAAGELLAERVGVDLATWIDVDGLTPDTAYTFRVEAVDWWGNETSDGPQVSATTLPPRPTWNVTPPELTVADVGTDFASFTWTGATATAGPLSYELSCYPTMGGDPASATFGDTETAGDVTGLALTAEYGCTLRALDANGLDAAGWPPGVMLVTSAPGSDVDAPTWPPGAAIVVGAVGDTFVELSWSAASDPSGLEGYQLRDLATGAIVLEDLGPGHGTSAVVGGLAPETSYTLRVDALDVWGNASTDGPEVTFATAAAPPWWTEGPWVVADAVSSWEIALRWSQAASVSGPVAYHVACEPTTATGSATFEALTWSDSARASPLSPGVEYECSVGAVTPSGAWAAASPSLVVTTDDPCTACDAGGTCVPAPPDVVCVPAHCDGDDLVAASTCDGAGGCVLSEPAACSEDLACDPAAGACPTSCRDNGDCRVGFRCAEGDGYTACVPLPAAGRSPSDVVSPSPRAVLEPDELHALVSDLLEQHGADTWEELQPDERASLANNLADAARPPPSGQAANQRANVAQRYLNLEAAVASNPSLTADEYAVLKRDTVREVQP